MAKHILNIQINNSELEIHGDYEKEEPMVMYYADMSGHPGSPASFEFEKIMYNETDVLDLIDSMNRLGEIEEIVLKEFE